MARLTGEDAALSVASGKVIDAAERKAAWDSVGSIGEPGKGENPASLKDIENIKVWMQKLEEQYVASEVLQQQTAGRNEHLEAQVCPCLFPPSLTDEQPQDRARGARHILAWVVGLCACSTHQAAHAVACYICRS